MLYLTTHTMHFIYGYVPSDHTDNKRGNPQRQLFREAFPKVQFIRFATNVGRYVLYIIMVTFI